ncbi:MAG: acyl-CoA dehydrogenase family protein [Acidimicrobiia bacterium]
MNPDLSADQQLFLDTTRRFLETEMAMPVVRSLADRPDGFDREWWKRGAELGWTSLLVPEALGGGSVSGDGVSDLVLVAETFGRAVAPGPLLPVNVVAAAIARCGTATQQTAVLPGIVSGDTIAAWAFAERGRSWDADGVLLTADRRGDQWVLNGAKAYVEAGAQASVLLVTARSAGGLTQFLVDAGTPGVTITAVDALDLVRRFSRVEFDTVTLPAAAVLGEADGAAADVEFQLQLALALQSAEMVGAIDRVFEFTVQWAFDRYSFGRPLASYQALKHRFADMKMWLEACHATATAAAVAVGQHASDAGELVRIAKAYIGDRAPEIVQDCVQLHGGIGVTWEHDLHLYLRRVTTDRALYGAPDDHLQTIAVGLGM